jgi:hypothetical protein
MQTDQRRAGLNCQFAFNVTERPAALHRRGLRRRAGATMPAGIPALKAGDIIDMTGPGSGNASPCGARVNATGQLVVPSSTPPPAL